MPTTSFDVHDPAFVADPYPVFDALRRESPVLWHEPLNLWLAFRYEHANEVLRHRRLGRVFRNRHPEETFGTFNWLHYDSILDSEPPKHTRLRSLVAKAFARGHIERLRPWVRDLADALIDRVAGAGRMDLIADYAGPLPVAVIAELLGVPEADRPLLRPWSNAIVKMYEYDRTPEMEAAAVEACAEFAEYLRELAGERRAHPQDDLVSHLAAVEDGGARLSENELIASCILLLNAGHEASVNVVGNGMVALFRNPHELARLREDPSLVSTAVEELIRYDAPLQLFERTAHEDVEIGGEVIAAGQKVAALLGSANRDPDAFERPDRLDVGRNPNPHIGFGAGIHFCLGAPLARLELQMSVPTLLRRLPHLALADEPRLRPFFVIRGYDEVRVTF